MLVVTGGMRADGTNISDGWLYNCMTHKWKKVSGLIDRLIDRIDR